MATREENLKKINAELEKLDDEQLEKVAGGLTGGQLALAGGLAEGLALDRPIINQTPIPREPSHGRPPQPSPMQ